MGKGKRRVRPRAHSALVLATLLISRSDSIRFNRGSKRFFFGRDMIPRAKPSRWDEEDLKLRELIQAKEWTPSTPNPPNGSRKASSSDSVLSPPDPPPPSSLSGEAPKTTKNRRPSCGPQKTYDHSLLTACIYLPLADPPSPPNSTPVPPFQL